MEPSETGKRYDRLARWWKDRHSESTYGLSQLERAIRYSSERGCALDAGCGSSGRFIRVLTEAGFAAEGLDISSEMIRHARETHPESEFYCEDICTWQPPKKYTLIAAWDSIFHLPLEMHEPVLAKLCDALAPDGILLFTCGGGHSKGEVSGSFEGEYFEYSTLGVNKFLEILIQKKFTPMHVEYDQHPLPHVVTIGKKEG